MKISKVKQAIIGKMWDNKGTASIVPQSLKLTEDTTFTADQSFLIGDMTFRVDRNLAKDVTVPKGQSLHFYANPQREGKKDAHYSVSIVLPENEAIELIESSKANQAKWLAENA